MNDTMSVAGATETRPSVLDHLDLVERLIRFRGLHGHHQVDEYRSDGYFAIAKLAVAGRCVGMDDPRSYLCACILNAFRNTRRRLGAPHRRFVQCPDDRPAGSTLPSREILPDRMAELREDFDLDHIVLPPPGPSPFHRRITPDENETIRRIVADNPTWGLIKIAREFQSRTGTPIAPSTVRRSLKSDALARERADLEVSRPWERNAGGRFGRTA